MKMANEVEPTISSEAAEILEGLSLQQKHISPKYFYDEWGSELFERITGLPEYYLTRTEQIIMESHLPEMAQLIGPRASIIEFGSGASIKVRLLLDNLNRLAAYVPVDISGDFLKSVAEQLARDYPGIEILPIYADFTQPFDLPNPRVMPLKNVVYFPGSTIGNFTMPEARSLLQVMRQEACPGGGLLIGVDLKKDRHIIEAAYNDSAGVTAEFNLNVLRRLNRELGADFDLGNFRHRAVYDEINGRIEMRLISDKAQLVHLEGQTVSFAAGEYIITEYSHKYSLEEFAHMAHAAGFQRERVWLDEQALFSVQYFTVPEHL
jgi:dimethylhistidine N-methyltransferase